MAESSSAVGTAETNFSNHLFREIYKNAFLNKVNTNASEKVVPNQAVFWISPKLERFWFVFCIHDDTEAYLEAYTDKKSSLMHRPVSLTYLNETLHVSSTICSEYKEYEFVVTLKSGVVRLLAPTREAMIDWVDTLRTKLTEMKVLTPCKNMYTALPLAQNLPKVVLLPTRDPTSPLPPPPSTSLTNAAIPLGTECVLTTTGSTTQTTPEETLSITNNCDLNCSQPSSTRCNEELSNTPPAEPYVTVIRVTDASVEASTSNTITVTTPSFDDTNTSDSVEPNPAEDSSQCEECSSSSVEDTATTISSCSHYDCVFVPDIASLESTSTNGIPQASVRRKEQPTESTQQTAAINHLAREMTQLTLREQQVLRLQNEIKHPTGVRIQLSRKDCNNAIALVDVFGGVWVAGWKQKDNPMLYNLLHIGDQIINVDSVFVENAADVHKHLRRASILSRSVTVIIKRIPFGKIFVIQREVEGQSLGIVQEQNTAVIKQVLANSLAARHGLSQRATTCDQLSFTNWVLTEVNGRPLNLFYKNNEVRDRLNAIGREISILVQPLDLIKQIKKQLKSIRNYKDYIVQ